MKSLVVLDHISKSIGNNSILEDISLSIEPGDSVVFVGHNGAGKSTLLRIIGGLTRVTSGAVKFTDNLKINYIPEHFPKMNISAKQYIEHMGQIEGLSKSEIADKSEELFRRFYMDKMQSLPMKNLSKGTLQKVAVIQALLVKPSLLLLDEPLSGQDTASQEVFVEAVNQLRREGTAVVMSCHEKFLIHRISNRVFEIADGSLHLLLLDDFSLAEYTVLTFMTKVVPMQIPPKTAQLSQIIEQKENILKIKVPKKNSSEVIIEQLKENWELRELSHENS